MSEQLSPVFAALGDDTRRRILDQLKDGDATVAQLAEPFSISQPAVSRHLKVLETAGLISRYSVATARYSHLEAARLEAVVEWLRGYSEFWVRDYDDLATSFPSDGEWII